MAGILQHLRSSTLDKRPSPGSMVDGQVAINYASGSPGMFFKDSNGNLVKVGPVHVGSGAPNASPASGGTAGNSIGEQWLDTSGGTYVFKVWDGSAWRSEAGEFVNVTGDTMTGTLTIGSGATIAFEGSTDDGFETTLTVVDPTADRTITFPNISGTVVTTGDSGTVTSTMLLDGTIVNADVNASAAIAGTKISPDFGSQNTTTTGTSTAASFIPTSSTVPTNGVYLPATNSVAISTNSSQRLLIDASGNVNIDSNTFYVDATNNRVGIGLNNPAAKLHLLEASAVDVEVRAGNNQSYMSMLVDSTGVGKLVAPGGTMTLTTGATERLRITSAGLVGIGTTPSSLLHLSASANPQLTITDQQTANTSGYVRHANGTLIIDSQYNNGSGIIAFTRNNNASESARIDTSGRLLVGTSSSITTLSDAPRTQIFVGDQTTASFIRGSANAFGPNLHLVKSRNTAPGSRTILQSGDEIGSIFFAGDDGSTLNNAGARILAQVDGTPGVNTMPGRLVFATTPATVGASATERMKITSAGGVQIGEAGEAFLTARRSANTVVFINRVTDDGNLIAFQQDGTTEGTISVSGTTVSYNGAHLSRWSQLPSGAERTEILRGSVLSNIDEMCEWGDEENEQLNRMKVSDVEGDKNVSGVFQAWDDDDDTYTNDFYCAMTGDFIIRIAAGVTVERGDLLMSAGDGTAKPQDDDIIRSKTIAKVTSTNVTCTYEDGSYCVPCVLMAC